MVAVLGLNFVSSQASTADYSTLAVSPPLLLSVPNERVSLSFPWCSIFFSSSADAYMMGEKLKETE